VDIGRNDVRRATLCDRRLRDGEIEAAAAVPDIENDTALLGGERGRQQAPILDDVGEGAADIGGAGIGVGEDVAGPQGVEDLRHQLARLDAADMAHDLGAGASFFACGYRPLEWLEAVLGDDVFGHAHLDAQHHVGVLGNRLGGRVDLRKVDIVELGDRERRQSHIGDVHEGVKAGARLRDDVAAEGRKVVGAGIAGRHAGCSALMRHQLVRRDADRGAIGIDMAVEVDQPRRHQLAAGIEDAQRAGCGNVGLHRLDDAVADAEIAPTAQRLARIEHIAAFDYQVELVIRPHGGARRTGDGAAERERRRRAEKFATRRVARCLRRHDFPPWCPGSDVRIPLPHALLRTSEPKGHERLYALLVRLWI
jgi:hypothetical protein